MRTRRPLTSCALAGWLALGAALWPAPEAQAQALAQTLHFDGVAVVELADHPTASSCPAGGSRGYPACGSLLDYDVDAAFSHASLATLDAQIAHCKDRIASANAKVCELPFISIIRTAKELGYCCVPDDEQIIALYHLRLGERLQAKDVEQRYTEAILDQARTALPEDGRAQRAWARQLAKRIEKDLEEMMPGGFVESQAPTIKHLAGLAVELDPDAKLAGELYAWASGDELLDSKRRQCEEAFLEHEYETAVVACELAYQLNPENVRVLEFYQNAKKRVGSAESTRTVLLSLLALLIFLLVVPAFIVTQGDLFLLLSSRELAKAAFRYGMALTPRWKRPYLTLARLFREEGRSVDEREVLGLAEARWPEDPQVLRALVAHHSARRDALAIRSILVRVVETGSALEELPELVAIAMSASTPIEDELVERLEAIGETEPDSPMIALLAKAYAQRDRSDEQALAAYWRSVFIGNELGDPRLKASLPLARILLERGRPDEAVDNAREAMECEPTLDAIECWIEALLQSELIELVVIEGTPRAGAMVLVPLFLRFVERSPEHQELVIGRLTVLQDESTDPHEATVFAILQHMLREQPSRDMLLQVSEATDKSPTYWAAVEALVAEYARRNPGDVTLLLRLATVHRLLGRNDRSILTLRMAARIPEAQTFARKQAVDLLAELELPQVFQLAAILAGLDSRVERTASEGWSEYSFRRMSEVEGAWWPELRGGQARIFHARPPTPEDLLGFATSLRRAGGDEPSPLGIIVSAGRPSATVLNLMLSLMIDDRKLWLLPVEERQLRDAVVNFKPRELMIQLRSQWLQGEDLFDKKNPVQSDTDFFGRGLLLKGLAGKVHRGEVFGLFGLRKIGKTSLSNRLRDYMTDAVVALVDLQEISDRSVASLALLLCERAKRDWTTKFPSLELPELEPIAEDAEAAVHQLERNIRRLQARILELSEVRSLLFLLDEIELMIPHEQDDGTSHGGFLGYEAFFRMLRGVHQADIDGIFSFAVVGADAKLCLDGKWGGRDNPVFQYFAEVYLGPLGAAECSDLITSLGAGMGVSFSDDALSLAYDFSGGHPMICRQLCSAAVTALGDQRPATLEGSNMVRAAQDFLARGSGYLKQIIVAYLTRRQRLILDVVAGHDEPVITRSTIMSLLPAKYRLPLEVGEDLETLENFSVLGRRGDQYHIPMRLLRQYVRLHRLGIED